MEVGNWFHYCKIMPFLLVELGKCMEDKVCLIREGGGGGVVSTKLHSQPGTLYSRINPRVILHT